MASPNHNRVMVQAADDQPRDFRQLRASGGKPGIGVPIGMGFAVSRDALARFLIRMGLRPNHCTALGFVWTCAAGVCLALGAGHQSPVGEPISAVPISLWPVWAGVFLALAAAMDMLDGSIARLGNMGSRFGGFLDSSLDRVSDMVVYLGCIWYFAAAGNLTFVVLGVLCIIHGTMVSYAKARAETLIPDCSVGYWLRGERAAATLIGAFSSHLPALIVQQAVLPAFTVWRRGLYTWQYLRAEAAGKAAPNRGPLPGAWRHLAPWRFPRGSVPYDVVTGINIAFLLFGPWVWPALYGRADPLGDWWMSLA
jgi:phosphatidylglycerophosphate synthase